MVVEALAEAVRAVDNLMHLAVAALAAEDAVETMAGDAVVAAAEDVEETNDSEYSALRPFLPAGNAGVAGFSTRCDACAANWHGKFYSRDARRSLLEDHRDPRASASLRNRTERLSARRPRHICRGGWFPLI